MFLDREKRKLGTNVGEHGENLAADFLKNLGWTILHKNYRTKLGEIDLIARDFDGTLVFIEVKALRDHKYLRPEDHLTQKKLDRVHRLAHMFANSNPQLVHKIGWRVDAITITLSKQEKDCVINHYQNV